MKLLASELTRLLNGCVSKQRAPILGGRELEVMKILWRHGELGAQQVLAGISDNSLSLSTMQSTLERLHRKGLLERTKSGRRYVYRAGVSRSTFISQLIKDISESISDGEMAPMVSGFMSFVDQGSAKVISDDVRAIIDRLPKDAND